MVILKTIQKHLVVSILVGMMMGFLVGLVVDTSLLRGSVGVLTFLMVYPMMVTLNYKSILSKGNWKLQATTQMINFLYLPFLAYLFGIVFFREMINFRLGILLIALLPTSGMTVSWTVMAKGNVKEAIRMIVFGLILGGLLTPFFIRFYIGEAIHIPFFSIFNQIIWVVFVPMLLGFLTQRLLAKKFGEERFNKTIKPVFPLFSTVAVIVLITLVMSFRSRMLMANPLVLLEILIPVTLGYFIMMISVHWIGRIFFNYADRIALVNGTMIRSLSLALAIALTVFSESGPEVALIIALAYIIQVQMAAWYVRRSIKELELKP